MDFQRKPHSSLVLHKNIDARKEGGEVKVLVRLRWRANYPPLLSILLANVDELRARISFQRDIRDCNILCLTESWLYGYIVPIHTASGVLCSLRGQEEITPGKTEVEGYVS